MPPSQLWSEVLATLDAAEERSLRGDALGHADSLEDISKLTPDHRSADALNAVGFSNEQDDR